MRKNILVIAGSPRKGGNSDLLCDEFIRGAKESGHHVDEIFLRDKIIGYCNGCGSCTENGGVCLQEDDMAEILEKLLVTDVIVMATPVYFYTIDAQMKTFIDRTAAKYTEISGKEFYFIITAADPDKASLERTVECFRGFTSCLPDPIEKGIIYGAGAWAIGDIINMPAMKEAYEMGRAIN